MGRVKRRRQGPGTDFSDDDFREWYMLSPVERFAESQRLWSTFLLLGGTCEPEPDSQSPFYFAQEEGLGAPDGRPGMHPVRSRGVHPGRRSPDNIERLRAALAALEAEQVFFPSLSVSVGHACHFRCLGAGLRRLRIDAMSRMRGVDSFARLWNRRVEIDLPGAGRVAVMALADLVRAKKTQLDKDWPMIRRLVEADVARAPRRPDARRIAFWLRECRTFDLLADLARRYPALARRIAKSRHALRAAVQGDERRTAFFSQTGRRSRA